MRPWITILPIMLLDQLTKLFIREQSIPIFPYLSLTYTQNTGILFGIFPQNNTLWIIITACIIGIIAYLYKTEPSYRLGLSFVIAGAASNLLDRVLHGFVIDFIDPKIWPVFNLADVAIVIGILLLLFFPARKQKPFNPSFSQKKRKEA